MGEQAAREEVRILHGLLQRDDDLGTTIGRRELRPPMFGVVARDDPANCRDGGGRVAAVVDVARIEIDRRAERQPEFLLERAAGDELAVAGRIELIAWRAAD